MNPGVQAILLSALSAIGNLRPVAELPPHVALCAPAQFGLAPLAPRAFLAGAMASTQISTELRREEHWVILIVSGTVSATLASFQFPL